MSDQTLMCRDCGQAFSFTTGEQAFYQERVYPPPQRCASCRAEKKAQRGESGGYSSSSYGGGYSSGRSSGGYSSGPRTMHPAVCTACGKETEVPFQPTSGKPVYCRDCFQSHRQSTSHYNRY